MSYTSNVLAADPENVKRFRADLTALGTVYINDACVQCRSRQ